MNKIVLTLISLAITASSLAVFAPHIRYTSRYSTSVAPEDSVADYEITRSEMETRPAMVTRPHPSERELSEMQQEEYLTPLSEQKQVTQPESTRRPEKQYHYHG